MTEPTTVGYYIVATLDARLVVAVWCSVDR